MRGKRSVKIGEQTVKNYQTNTRQRNDSQQSRHNAVHTVGWLSESG